MTPVLPISFLTDYGTADGFVAACRGVMARIAPEARVFDITHEVPPGDIRRGALLLAQTLPYLPPGVHVAVVDPGVGTARRGVLVRTSEHLLVGPDNGLLPWAADALGGIREAYELGNPALMLPQVSATFHGRDVFAPVAAHLGTGTPPSEVGRRLDAGSLVRLPDPVAYVDRGTAYAEVLTEDRFGNVQLSLTERHIRELGVERGGALDVEADGDVHWVPYRRTFGDVAAGALVALLDSAGYIALTVNGGDAARALRVRPGDPVKLRRPNGGTGAV